MSPGVSLLHPAARVGTTLTKGRIKSQATRTLGKRNRLGRQLARDNLGEVEAAPPHTHPDRPRASSHINDSYCLDQVHTRLLAGSPPFSQTQKTLNVKPHVVSHVPSAPGHSQKKELSPGRAECYPKNCLLKSVKSVSCVTQLSCVQLVESVKNAALNLPVRGHGGRVVTLSPPTSEARVRSPSWP